MITAPDHIIIDPTATLPPPLPAPPPSSAIIQDVVLRSYFRILPLATPVVLTSPRSLRFDTRVGLLVRSVYDPENVEYEVESILPSAF